MLGVSGMTVLNQVPRYCGCVWRLLQDQQRADEGARRCAQVFALAAVCLTFNSPTSTLFPLHSILPPQPSSPDNQFSHLNPSPLPRSDTWLLDMKTLRWSKAKKCGGCAPTPRCSFSCLQYCAPIIRLKDFFRCSSAPGTSRACWCSAASPTTMRWRRARSSMTCACLRVGTLHFCYSRACRISSDALCIFVLKLERMQWHQVNPASPPL